MTETATHAPLEGIVITAPDEPGQLVTVTRNPLDLFLTPGVITALLARIRQDAVEFTPDVTTDKGRKQIASRAFRVSQAKTYLDDLGKAEVAQLKDLPRQVDAARKLLRDGLDALKVEVRHPLTEWEERRSLLQHRLGIIQNTPASMFNSDAIAIQSTIETITATPTDGATWQEFAQEASSVKLVTLATLQEMLEKRQRWEADQAELARLREADAKRKQEDKEEQLRKEGEARALAAAQPKPMVVETPVGTLPLPAGAIGAMVQINEQPAEFIPATPAPVTTAQADAIRRGEPMPTGNTEVEHRRVINRAAYEALLPLVGGDQDMAKAILGAIVNRRIPAVTITY
jgi:hypothetical protein